MNRDKQISILDNANVRAKDNVGAWLADPQVKATIRGNHEFVRSLKAPPKRKIG